jgi:uncharacterized protein involved in outer membrane biogenesis
MMTRFRRVISVTGIIVAIVLGLAAAAPYLVDEKTVRDQFVARLSGWAGGSLHVGGDVRIKSLFDLTVRASNVEIRSPARFSDVVAITAERVEGRLNVWALLNGRIVFDKVWVRRPRISLRGEPAAFDGKALWRRLFNEDRPLFEDALNAVEQAPFIEVQLIDGLVVSAAANARALPGLGRFSLRVVHRPEMARVTAEGQVDWRGQPIDVSIARGRFESQGPTRAAYLGLSGSGPSLGAVSLEGRIVKANNLRYLGSVEVDGAHVKELADLFDLPTGPALRAARLSASGNIEAGRQKLSLQQLAVSFGGMRADGLLSLDLSKPKPKLSGTLGLTDIDLRGVTLTGRPAGLLGPQDPLQVRRKGTSGRGRRLASWLKTFDADLRISAESLALDGISAGPSAAFFSIDEGVATLDLAELRVFGGTLNGQFALLQQDGGLRLRGKGKATSVDLGQFLTTVTGLRLAGGQADVTFSLKGAGADPAALAQGAKFRGRISALEGGDLAINLAALAAQGSERGGFSQGARTQIVLSPGSGDYGMLRAAFMLAGSKLRLHILEIAEDGWLIRGQGQVDMAQRTLSLRCQAVRAEGATAAAASLFSRRLVEPGADNPVEFRIRGPWLGLGVRYGPPKPALTGARG